MQEKIMKVNRITYSPRSIVHSKSQTPAFGAVPAKVKDSIINCGMFAAIVGIGVLLAKFFKNYPQNDSIFLNDGSYFCEAYELNELA